MKSLIINLLVYSLYILLCVYFIYHFSYSNSSYVYLLKYAKSPNEIIRETFEFYKKGLNAKNKSEVKKLIYEDPEGYSIIHMNMAESAWFKGVKFQFDSSGNVSDVSVGDLMYESTRIGEPDEIYSPILSYIFESTNYDSHIWGRWHAFWVLSMGLFTIILLVNFGLLIYSADFSYLYNIVFTALFVLLTNFSHLVISNKYTLLNMVDTAGQMEVFYSPNFLFNVMGLKTHYVALISDVSIIAILVILISVVVLYRKRNKLMTSSSK